MFDKLRLSYRFVPLTSKYLSSPQCHDRILARNSNLPQATKRVWRWHYRNAKFRRSKRGREEKKRKSRGTTYKYIALYARYAIFSRAKSRHSLEETKCRPTSAAATRNFVTSLPSCNDALSWISTRFPPVSDRLSTGEREKEKERAKSPPSPPAILLSFTFFPHRVEKKIEFQLDPRDEQARFVRVNPFMVRHNGGMVTGSRTKAR